MPLYKPVTRKGPVFLAETNEGPPTIIGQDGQSYIGVRADQRGGAFFNEGRYQWVFDNDVLGLQNATINYGSMTGQIADGGSAYEGDSLANWVARERGSVGAAGGVGGGGGAGGAGGFPGGPNTSASAFVSPNVVPFGVSAPKIGVAPFKFTDPVANAKRTGDFNREQFATDFDLALGDARRLASEEFDILNQYSQKYAPLRRESLRQDNQINREELKRSVDFGVPQARSFLSGQFDLADTLGQGRLPGSLDKAFEDSIRSTAADNAIFRGFGGDSVFGTSVSDKLSARERLGLIVQGSDIGTRALQNASSLYVDRPIKVDTTASFPQTPTVSPQQVAIGQRSQRGAGTTLDIGTALSADINQQQFRTSQVQGVNNNQAQLDFGASTFNSGQAFSAQLTNKQLELGNAIRASDKGQQELDITQAEADSETAAGIRQEQFDAAQGQAATAAGVGAVATVGAAVLPPLISGLTSLFTGGGGTTAASGTSGGPLDAEGIPSGPLDFNQNLPPALDTGEFAGENATQLGTAGTGYIPPSQLQYGGTGAGGGGIGAGSPSISIGSGGGGGQSIPSVDSAGSSGLANDYNFSPEVSATLSRTSTFAPQSQAPSQSFPVVPRSAPLGSPSDSGIGGFSGGIAPTDDSGAPLPSVKEIIRTPAARLARTTVPTSDGGFSEVGGITQTQFRGNNYTVTDDGNWTRNNKDGTITESTGVTTRPDGRLIAGASSTRAQAIKMGAPVATAIGVGLDQRDRVSPVRAAGNGQIGAVKNLLQGEWDFARTFPTITPETASPIRALQVGYKALREGKDTPSFMTALAVDSRDAPRISEVIEKKEPKANEMYGLWLEMSQRVGMSVAKGEPVKDLMTDTDKKMGIAEFGQLDKTRTWLENSLKSSGYLHGKTITNPQSVMGAVDAMQRFAKNPDAPLEERSAIQAIATDGIVHGYGLTNPKYTPPDASVVSKELSTLGPKGLAAFNLVQGLAQTNGKFNQRQVAESALSVMSRYGKSGSALLPGPIGDTSEQGILTGQGALAGVLGVGGGALAIGSWDKLTPKQRTDLLNTGVKGAAAALIATGDPRLVQAGQLINQQGAAVFGALGGALSTQQGLANVTGGGSSIGTRAVGATQAGVGAATVANAGASAVGAAPLVPLGAGVAAGALGAVSTGYLGYKELQSRGANKGQLAGIGLLAPSIFSTVGVASTIKGAYEGIKGLVGLTGQQGAIKGAGLGSLVGMFGGPVGLGIGAAFGGILGAGGAGFGGGKGKAQQDRDEFRGAMQQTGVYDKDFQVTLADGTGFNPANAKQLPWFDKSKTEGNPFAKDTRQSFDIDYTSDLDMAAGIGGMTLSRLLLGSESTGDGRHYDQLGGEMTNAAVSNTRSREFNQENFSKSMENLRSMYTKSGIASADQVKRMAGRALKSGKMNQFEYDQALQAGALVFGNDYKTAQQLMQGRWE